MRFIQPLSLYIVLTMSWQVLQAQTHYFPPKASEWETRKAVDFGLNQNKLDAAVSFAKENEYSGSKDLRIAILKGFAREPFHSLLGPTKKRSGPSGLILKNGYIIAEWGDTERVDMTFSVTKSYLSTVAGLAVDRALFKTDQLLSQYVWDSTFEGEHNSKIRWKHLLNQSSDWSGSLWDIKDWADRPPKEGGLDAWKNRTLNEPGTYYKYNDVRVNLLAYSLLQVWRKPLPQILKEYIMDPIGASSTWRWYGYENSWVNVDGNWVQSVSGGGHSGGGLFISAKDHARFGLLFLNNGNWDGKQLLSPEWIKEATSPSPANPSYGYLWWLNNPESNRYVKKAGKDMYYASGFGGNYIVILPKYDTVIITRWLEPSEMKNFMGKVLEAY